MPYDISIRLLVTFMLKNGKGSYSLNSVFILFLTFNFERILHFFGILCLYIHKKMMYRLPSWEYFMIPSDSLAHSQWQMDIRESCHGFTRESSQIKAEILSFFRKSYMSDRTIVQTHTSKVSKNHIVLHQCSRCIGTLVSHSLSHEVKQG